MAAAGVNVSAYRNDAETPFPSTAVNDFSRRTPKMTGNQRCEYTSGRRPTNPRMPTDRNAAASAIDNPWFTHRSMLIMPTGAKHRSFARAGC
jgi:hypothetical protein